MQAILFDLDGTLWDACDVLTRCWNRTLAEKFPDLGRTLTLADLQSAMGKTVEQIGRLFFPHADPARACEAVCVASQDELEELTACGGCLYDDLPEVLAALSARYFLGIVSNCQCGYIEAFLQAHGLAAYFSDFLCAGMTGRCKGENIQEIMAKNGLTEAIYVGDTRSDEEAARLAGLPFVHAAYGFGDAQAPDEVITTPRELSAVAARLLP